MLPFPRPAFRPGRYIRRDLRPRVTPRARLAARRASRGGSGGWYGVIPACPTDGWSLLPRPPLRGVSGEWRGNAAFYRWILAECSASSGI
jgi:hypothetical protein